MNEAVKSLSRFRTLLPLSMAGVLLLIWSMPGTIALRTLLLVGLFVIVVMRYREIPPVVREDLSVQWLCLGFLAFSGWACLNAIAIAQEPDWSLRELLGQHPRALVALTVGIGLGALYAQRAFAGLKFVLLGCLLVHLADFLIYWLQTGQTFLGLTTNTGRVFGQKLLISYIANMYGAFVAADLVSVAFLPRTNARPWRTQLAQVGFLVLMTFLIGARNGYIGLAFLTISTVLLLVICSGGSWQRRAATAALLGLPILALLATLTWHSDPRWARFGESAAAALDPARSRTWLDGEKHPLPILEDGQPVDGSTYMRIAGLRGAVQAAMHFPLGYGFGRNAYSHAWNKLVGEGKGTSLSGLGDVLVALGFPGLLLWIAVCSAVAIHSLAGFFRRHARESLVAAFLSAGFLGRSLVDSNIRDHSLETFLFLTGAMVAAAAIWNSMPDESGSKTYRGATPA